MIPLFIYSFGPDPYGDGHGLSNWGERKGKFPDIDSALRGILMGHPFPVALTGRYKDVFMPGVSLDNVPSSHVIQIWSTEPTALQNIKDYSKRFPKARPDHWPHTGDGTNVGLQMEIHVGKIADWQTPVLAGFLTDGTSTPACASPAGRYALTFNPQNRNALQVRMLQSRLAGIGTGLRVKESVESLKHTMANFAESSRMLNAYLNGTHGLQILARGDRAPASDPYHIFQSRLYLDEELGLIANLTKMDHRDVETIDNWLMAKSRWKKLLPLPKCILVTRICRDAKDYPGMNAFEATYHNQFNLESLVWIRDGENVWRFATDIQFDERVFPTSDDAPALVANIQENIWKKHWSGLRRREMEEWHNARVDSKKKEKAPDPATLVEPVAFTWKDQVEFKTLEQFLESEHYTPELDAYIRRRAADGARQHQREMMPFALLIQGIIDHKNLLSVPPGTDIFDPEQHHRFIRLVSDFTGGISDSRYTSQWEAMTKLDALKPGTRILGWRWARYTEKYSHAAKWNRGRKDADGFCLFTVHHLEEQKEKSHERYHKLHVHEFELSKRWVGPSPFTKQLSSAAIDAVDWLPIDLPVSLAEHLLDDRNWKREHQWAVPILAQWKKIRVQIPAVQASPEPVKIRLGRAGTGEEDFE